ncbi:MAG: hypothetical protein ACYC6N_23125 [Pirellulaceae bacterium]
MYESYPSLMAQHAAPLLERISPHDIIPVIAITLTLGGGVLIALTAIILGTWRKARDRKIVASLIQDMLDRNMSAAEIQQIMSTWQSLSDSEANIPEAHLVPSLAGRPPKPAKLL